MSFGAIWLIGSVVWAWGVYMVVATRCRHRPALPPAEHPIDWTVAEREAEIARWNRVFDPDVESTFRVLAKALPGITRARVAAFLESRR